MIGSLRGRLRHAQPQVVLVEVGGVGYEVHVPLSTWYRLEAAGEGAEVELRIHTHVREDALQLFGFFTERERQLFLRLIQVSGIGPRLAQTVLSGMSPGDFVAALLRADVRALSTIPGIGKKTAERMVLELKDKVHDLAGSDVATTVPSAADGDLVAALVNLGYKPAHAERAVAAVEAEASTDLDFADRLKAALRKLSRV